jgi:aminoglycoside phosphotransferase (APT) family kinase protein
VLDLFTLAGEVSGIAQLPVGHINDSYRVDAGSESYLLQRLNPQVFPDAGKVMDNVSRVTAHATARLRAAGVTDWRRRTLALVSARSGADWVRDGEGAAWRLFGFITGTVVRERAESPTDALAAGRVFGEFLRLLADYHGAPLTETIPGFHDTAARFERLEQAVRKDARSRVAGAGLEIELAMNQRQLADVLPPLLRSGAVPVRIAHNDAKLANVLLDERSGEPLCVVDLDTVMPGSALYDFGDLVRSVTSPSLEDEEDLSQVGVRVPMFEALARGYLDAAGAILTAVERDQLVFAGRLITLEQAVRFLTDHLEGDRYYRIARPGHNLIRARTQLRLFESLTERAGELQEMIRVLASPQSHF